MKAGGPGKRFGRNPAVSGLVVLFLLHGCGFAVSRVDGRLNVLHHPDFTIESIGLLDKKSLNQQTVVTLKVRENWPIPKKRGPVAKGIAEGAGKGVDVGWEICTYEREEKPSYQGANDEDYGIAGELIGRVIVCPLLLLSGALVGGVGGAIVGPSDMTQVAPFADGLVVRETLLHKQLVKELWSQLIHLNVRDYPPSYPGTKAIQFVETGEAASFVNIDPTEVSLMPLNDSSSGALTLKMRVRLLFYDKNKTLWGEELLEASFGEYPYDRWKDNKAQLVKEGVDRGLGGMAKKLVADLQSISRSLDATIPVGTSSPQPNVEKGIPTGAF